MEWKKAVTLLTFSRPEPELFGCECAPFIPERREWAWEWFRDHQGCHSHHRPGDVSSLVSQDGTHLACFSGLGWRCPGASESGLSSQRASQSRVALLCCWVAAPVGLEGRVTKGDDSPAFRSNGIYFAWFWTCLGPPMPSFLPFRMEMSILCLFHHCILEAYKLSGFTGSQFKRNFALWCIIPQVSPISDEWDGIYMVFRWDFGL